MEDENPGSTKKGPLSHLNERGEARMVDVGAKPATEREAVVRGSVRMQPETLVLITEGNAAKGDVLAAARIAGIMAAKRTGELIPLCHPLPLDWVEVRLRPDTEDSLLEVEARARTTAKTGVEMEAFVAASIAAVTVYDMCKSYDRTMVVTDLRLVSKSGGKSGVFVREEDR